MFITLLAFVLVLALIVLVHELGHFITARKTGMKVYEFGFGFPPRAVGVYKDPKTKKFKWVWGSGKKRGANLKNTVGGGETDEDEQYPATVYSLNWLPLGGFCKIKGENGEKENESDSFGAKKAWKKILVLVAGVTMNFLLAGILLGVGFMIGLPADVSVGSDPKAIIVQGPDVVIQMVEKDSPAEVAGLKTWDKVLSINSTEIDSSEGMIVFVKESEGEELTLKIARADEELEIIATPTILEGEDRARLGISLADAATVRYPWYVAIYKGFVAAGIAVVNITVAFYILIKNLILGNGMMFNVAGPVGIAVMAGESARLGISYLINFTAMISITLAIINILPIPALDGGRILFILIRKIIRRPVPLKYEQAAHTVTFILLMGLFAIITVRDVIGLF